MSELEKAVRAREREFEKKFGRPMGPNDPLLFDEDSDIPVPTPQQKLLDQMALAMDEAGIPGALIWIYIKTGLIPAEANRHLMSRQMKRGIRQAAAEYEEGRADLNGWLIAARERRERQWR